jgi:hypothetical protein
MKSTVDFYSFRRAFEMTRATHFSYEGLNILFGYLEEYEESTGEEIELDVISLCCDFYEDHWTDIAENYDIDLSDIEDEDEKKKAVEDYLNNNTMLCGETKTGSFIYQVF